MSYSSKWATLFLSNHVIDKKLSLCADTRDDTKLIKVIDRY